MYYDLHIHTNESDGKYAKMDLLRYINQKDFKIIAFCDHNICNNVNPEWLNRMYEHKYGEINKAIIIPAVELDADNEKYRRIHILGYGIRDTKLIMKKLEQLKMQNVEVTKKQIQLIRDVYGIDITEDIVAKIEGTPFVSSIGLKKALIDMGVAKSVSDTYKFVSHKSLTHVNREKMSDIDAIKIIRECGGVPILAHPTEICYKSDGRKIGYSMEYENYLQFLIKFGLDGVETHTVKHNEDEKNEYFRINQNYGLISTAGSDFHDEERTPVLGLSIDPDKFVKPLIQKMRKRNIEFKGEKTSEEYEK